MDESEKLLKVIEFLKEQEKEVERVFIEKTLREEFRRKLDCECEQYRMALLQMSRQSIYAHAQDIELRRQIREYLIKKDDCTSGLLGCDNLIDTIFLMCHEAGMQIPEAVETLIGERR